MKTINQMVVTHIPRQPYINWANGFDDGGAEMDTEQVCATSVLIPNSFDAFNDERFLGLINR